jgi:hypothetical protein
MALTAGMLVCVQCAGLQIQLVGAPTTKPRSIILDRVDEQVLQLAALLGNSTCNQIWVAWLTLL